jgi:transcriptional regulator
MIYMPKHFAVDDRAAVLDVMRSHPFATVVSAVEGAASFSHIPVVARERDGAIVLLGHVARANPHWKSWEQPGGAPVTVVFNGPSAYVSPSWYVEKQAVPTWNYVVVHAHGRLTTTHDSAAKERILKALIDEHDPPYREFWDVSLSEDYREKMKAAIVGCEIVVERFDGKFKVSQNRQKADQRGVLQAMDAGGAQPRALAAWMRRFGVGDAA